MKLILIAIVTYLAYSMFQRYKIQNQVKNSKPTQSSKNKYSKMNIRDAEYKDIDEN